MRFMPDIRRLTRACCHAACVHARSEAINASTTSPPTSESDNRHPPYVRLISVCLGRIAGVVSVYVGFESRFTVYRRRYMSICGE